MGASSNEAKEACHDVTTIQVISNSSIQEVLIKRSRQLEVEKKLLRMHGDDMKASWILTNGAT